MTIVIEQAMSIKSVDLLKARGLSEQEVSDFSDLLLKANKQLDENVSAKQVLTEMLQDELELLRLASALASSIQVNSLSKEGSINLLAQPDNTGLVDLNNDGIVEIGVARKMIFPPVNAPARVLKAWNEATQGMSEFDKRVMELEMHVAIYGVEIYGKATKVPLPPEAQWSSTGVQKLLKTMREGVEFDVERNGWTRLNLVKLDVYDKLEERIA